MKKYICGILTLALAGCVNEPAQVTATPSASAEVKDTVWAHDPDLDFDEAGEIPSYSYTPVSAVTTNFGTVTLYVDTVKTGYSGEWNHAGYTSDAMLVEKGNKQGIYSMDGSELYPVTISKVSTPYMAGVIAGLQKGTDDKQTVVFGYADTAKSTAHIFSSDFKEMKDVPIDQFNYEAKPTSKNPFLAYKVDEVGIAGVKRSDTGAMKGWEFEKYDCSSINANMILPVIDDAYSVLRYALVGPDGSLITYLSQDMTYRTGSYINESYAITDGTYTSLVDAKSETNIITQYQAAKYFEDGYAAVKKYGKWGYVDASGKEVTDFIFEDACAVNHGLAWVKYHGKYGILDFTNTLKDAKKQINAYWCAPTDEKEIGQLTVKESDLSIRDTAGSDGSQVGICKVGSVYPVFEKKTDANYTWYRINKENWVASEGTWAYFEETK